MVVDATSHVAILLREPEADAFARLLVDAPVRLMSAATRVELSFVTEGRNREAGRADLDRDSPDGSRSGVNICAFFAFLQDRSEVWPATVTLGSTNDG